MPPPQRAVSPSPTRRGHSLTIHGRELAAQMREISLPTTFPTLTRSNYGDWSLLMRAILQTCGLWDAVDTGVADYHDNRATLKAVLRAMPPEMLTVLSTKRTAKKAWDAVKTMRMGSTAVCEAKAQGLGRDFEDIRFKSSETVDDFGMRLSGLVKNLSIHGDPVSDGSMVRKFLRVVPRRYVQVALSIETLVDLDTLTIEELTGRLKVAEERLDQDGETEAGGRLLLIEEEWRVHLKRDVNGAAGGSNSFDGQRRGRGRGRGHDGKGMGLAGVDVCGSKGGNGTNTDRDKCHYCGIADHWARDCRKKKREEARLV